MDPVKCLGNFDRLGLTQGSQFRFIAMTLDAFLLVVSALSMADDDNSGLQGSILKNTQPRSDFTPSRRLSAAVVGTIALLNRPGDNATRCEQTQALALVI